jgi:branched-chain amino acid transport system ATP-binding protein
VTALLEVDGLVTGYGRLEILHGVSLHVGEGEIVSLLGANGAGKTTLLRAISGLLPTWRGTIRFAGRRLGSMRAERRTALGLGQLPEGRGVFQTLTVRENLDLSLVARRTAPNEIDADRDRLLDIFPILRERLGQDASSLSGGQQQMLVLARAMMARPQLLMVDELSFGLAPQLVDRMFEMVADLRNGGTTFLLVEQHAGVLEISDRTYVLRTGRNDIEGPSSQIAESSNLVRAYLGESA